MVFALNPSIVFEHKIGYNSAYMRHSRKSSTKQAVFEVRQFNSVIEINDQSMRK